jgi:hypothetical protein
MEANEAGELRETAENAKESSSQPIAFTMSVLAVLVAITTVMGHRTHTEAVLNQNRATDQWNLYQAKNIRSTDTANIQDLLSVTTIADSRKADADKIAKRDADRQTKWANDLKEEEEKARELEEKVEQAEKRADRLDLGEALLEIALVTSSITLLTSRRIYWFLGMFFGLAGVISVATSFFLS